MIRRFRSRAHPRPVRRAWTWPSAVVALAVLIALATAVAADVMPLTDAIAVAWSLLGG